MINSKVACEFISSKLPLEMVAKQLGITNAECYQAIHNFCKEHPQGKLVPTIKRKLKMNLASSLLSYAGSREKFVEEYGIPDRNLVAIIYSVIEDESMVKTDALADRLFRKLTEGRVFCSASMPKRIVRIIGQYYANTKSSQAALAASYGVNDSTISGILRRGIADGIFDDVLADKVYAKIRDCKYMTKATMKAYNAAFDKRIS